MKKEFTFIDLFAGIGGMRIAFDKAGGRCVFSSEWNKFSQQTYETNFGDIPDGDITEIKAKDIPNHDILVGGFPCQPFSLAGVSSKKALGRKHGFEDETQGTLFFDIVRIIREKKPKAFLLENVKNLKSHDKGKTFKVIMKKLQQDLEYDVHVKIVDASSVVPQHRERIFIVGFKKPMEFRLRYFEKKHHQELLPEFKNELDTYGRIYMYRLRPDYKIYARPLEEYPAKSKQAAAIMLMIQNNLDPAVAQHPHELITYGGNGGVFSNWAQYRLTMKYLAEMNDEQTLVMYSGHPMGLFPSHKEAPRVVVTNGMMIPNYSKPDDWEKFNALGVTQYGQMTAGSYMYIGPQGIVHGTTITVLNGFRKIGKEPKGNLFVTSG